MAWLGIIIVFKVRMFSKKCVLSSLCIFVTLFLISSSGIFASEVLDNFKMARRYLDADLVLIGNVLSCSTQIIEEEDQPGSNGWVQHSTKLMNTYRVKVDSILKGDFPDSVIVIQNESFKTYASRTTFNKLDEKGDSMFLEEQTLQTNDEGWDRIPGLGKFILLLKKKDGLYTSILCHSPDEYSLNLYRQVKEKGEDYFKPPEPQRK